LLLNRFVHLPRNAIGELFVTRSRVDGCGEGVLDDA
jgi:hypothetical protein